MCEVVKRLCADAEHKQTDRQEPECSFAGLLADIHRRRIYISIMVLFEYRG
jgi:hypothetical protein